MAKRFFIIDGLSQIFRSYYAPFRPLSSPSGEPTKATYVFCNMLLQLIREQKPDFLVMAMESRVPVFREEIDPQYKANREPPPEDLAPQIERIVQIVRTMNIPVYEVPGYEADDVIATAAAKLADEAFEVIMVSKDKDLEQVLTDKVKMFDPNKQEFIGPDELEAKKGYRPEKAIDIQTLIGDSTDNVPGVKGVGPKKAADLIRRFGSARAVLEHAAELTPAMRKNIDAFAEQMDTTCQLVTLKTDIPLEIDLEQCRLEAINFAGLLPIFEELGFQRLADLAAEAGGETQSRDNTAPRAAQVTDKEYILVDTAEKFATFLDELKKQKRFALDTETDNLRAIEARLVGMSFCWQTGRAFYLPLMGMGPCLDTEPTLDALRPILASEAIVKVGQNLKYDILVLRGAGIELCGELFDTMIASFVLDSSRRSHGMDALARELLGVETIPISDLIGKGKSQITFDSVETQRACEYAAEDADVTWRLGEVFREQLQGSGLENLFHETEMPLVRVLADMEYEGVRIDTTVLAEMSELLRDRLNGLTDDIHREVGHEFNIDSTKALAKVLFEELGLTPVKKTKTGMSTDAETLATLAETTDNPVPRLVGEYRELTKLKGTYIDPLPEMICRKTCRIHASFHQTGAITGRLSSSDPNLQNIPIRTEMGRQIRRAFVPRDENYVLLTADYSQIELRILAHFSKDEALIRAFEEDRDIHRFVAAQVFGVPLEEVSREQRGRAKAVNFGIVYGQTAYGLSRSTGMPVGEAQRFIDMYFMRYPGIRFFIDGVIDQAKRDGFVQTILGRRRAVPDINSRNRNVRQGAERLAVNTIIQGSAADLIKRAMIHIHHKIHEESWPLRLLIQVHDELVFDAPRQTIERDADFVRRQMCEAMALAVPVKVDLSWADNWLESK